MGEYPIFCESTYILDRITSRRRNPNSLSAAACCDILDIISRKEQRYGRLLRLIRTVYTTPFTWKKRISVPFFHRTTWFNHARATESSLRRLRLDLKELKRNLSSSAENNIHLANSFSLREIIERTLPQELAREINAIGPQYTLALMNHLRLLQRSDSKIDGAPEPLSPGIDEYSSDSSLETSSTSSKGILPIGEWY